MHAGTAAFVLRLTVLRPPSRKKDDLHSLGLKQNISSTLANGDTTLGTTSINNDSTCTLTAHLVSLGLHMEGITFLTRVIQEPSCGEKAIQVSRFVEIVTVCSLASLAKVKLSVERSRVASSTSLCP